MESLFLKDRIFQKKHLKKDYNLKLAAGHTTIRLISCERKIYKTENYIDVDCEAIVGWILSAYCLDTG